MHNFLWNMAICTTVLGNKSIMEITGYKHTVIPPFHIHSRDSRTDEPEVMQQIIKEKFKRYRQF